MALHNETLDRNRPIIKWLTEVVGPGKVSKGMLCEKFGMYEREGEWKISISIAMTPASNQWREEWTSTTTVRIKDLGTLSAAVLKFGHIKNLRFEQFI